MAISTIPSAGLTNGGTPVADYWYLNTGFSNTADTLTYLTTNLTKLDMSGTGTVGGVTQSSGVFTFPQTGLYRVAFVTQYYSNTNTARFCSSGIYLSTDSGSNYSVVALAQSAINAIVASSNTFVTTHAETQINVSNTSTIKVKFSVQTSNTINVNGNSGNGVTYMIFTRLGNSV